MDHRRNSRRNLFNEQPSQRHVPIFSRPVYHAARLDAISANPVRPASPARPVNLTNSASHASAARPVSMATPMASPAPGIGSPDSPIAETPAESLLRAYREQRIRREKAALLCGLAVFILTVAFVALLISKLHPTGQARISTPVAAQPGPQVVYPTLSPGQTKILLLGSDQRPDDPSYRTDVIILLTIDPAKTTVSAVSFPRDLWVKVPSLYEMKINQVFALGGFDAMAEMFQANFGFTPDYYVLTNFSGFTGFVDSQGGVDVQVAQELTDACDLPQAKNGDCTVKSGTVHMDGATALWYVRSRDTSSDFDRLRRSQEVLYGLFKKMINLESIAKLGEIKAALNGKVETNISPEKAFSFLPFAVRLLQSPDHIQRFAITEDEATPSWSWNGMWILLPDTDAIHSLLQKAGVQP